MNQTSIYVLECPIEKKIRYVGMSRKLEQRYLAHLQYPMDHLKEWIDSIKKAGLTPKMIEIEKPENGTAKNREVFWIKFYQKKFGCLLNKRHVEIKQKKKLNIVYLK